MRYNSLDIIQTDIKKKYYKNKIYPNIPLSDTDEYIITTFGDRLDKLAYSYYKDVNLWWIISMANNNITKGLMFPKPGTQLRIPINVSDVIKKYNEFNKAR